MCIYVYTYVYICKYSASQPARRPPQNPGSPSEKCTRRRSKRVTGTHGIESSRVGRTRASSDQACVSASYPCASRALESAAGCLYHAPVCLRRLQEANSTATPQNPGSPSGQRMWQTLRMSHGHTQDRVESRGPDWGQVVIGQVG
jgi:hypothetical protein